MHEKHHFHQGASGKTSGEHWTLTTLERSRGASSCVYVKIALSRSQDRADTTDNSREDSIHHRRIMTCV